MSPKITIRILRLILEERRHPACGSPASCRVLMFPAKIASRMLTNRRQDVGAPIILRNRPLPSSQQFGGQTRQPSRVPDERCRRPAPSDRGRAPTVQYHMNLALLKSRNRPLDFRYQERYFLTSAVAPGVLHGRLAECLHDISKLQCE